MHRPVLTQEAACASGTFTDRRRAQGRRGRVPRDAVPSGDQVLLLGQAVLAPDPSDERWCGKPLDAWTSA